MAEILENVRNQLIGELEPLHLLVDDVTEGTSECGLKLNIIIVSRKFEGLPTLAQHRLVNKALESEREKIHAITLKTYTPEKWDAMTAQNETKVEN